MSTEAMKAAHAAKLKASNELRSFYSENADAEPSAELTAKEDAIHAEIAKQDERMSNLLDSAELEMRAVAALSNSGVQDGSGREDRGDSEERSDADELRSIASGEKRSHVFEARDNVTLNKGTATDGAEVIDSTLFGQLTAFMRENATVMLGGARTVNTTKGEDMIFPRVTSYSAASIVAELGTIGKDSPQFDTVTIGAYKYAFLTALSNELLQDQAFDITGWLAQQGGEALARGAGAHLMVGTGSSQPNGIFTAATTGVTAAGAAAITGDELIDLQHSIASPYRSNAAFLMNDSTLKLVRKLKDGENQYLWRPGLIAGHPDTLLGNSVLTDDNAPAATTGLDSVLYGDLSSYVVRIAKGAEVTRSDEYGFDSDSVFWRFIMRVDGDLVDTNGVRVLTQA